MTVAPELIDPGHDDLPVWSVNWASVLAFDAVATQWRTILGHDRLVYLGLDYAGVDVVLRRGGYADTVFDDLRVMEAEALTVLNERS